MEEWLQNLGAPPLMVQPGERWSYHVSGDVLGRPDCARLRTTAGCVSCARIFELLEMQDDQRMGAPAYAFGDLLDCCGSDAMKGIDTELM